MMTHINLCYIVLAIPYAMGQVGGPPIPEGASSLAFVFDITGSMYDDLVQVIAGAAKIMATTLSRREKPLYNYILVPFHDPDVGPILVTTDPDEFQGELRNLYVQGGGDCPEMSISAIREALDVALPFSYIYVFTDARSKDFHLTEDVLSLIQQKQSQVVFVLTGDCGDHTSPGFKAYEKIASTSSGQVFLLKKDQVDEVLNFVRLTVQTKKVNLMSIDQPTSHSEVYELPVDSKLKEFTVSVSGGKPSVELYSPTGELVTVFNGLRELLDLKKVKIVNVKDPDPGQWRLKIVSDSAHTIRVTGLSEADFTVGFSRQPNTIKTELRPLGGVQTHTVINASGIDHPGKLNVLQLVNLNGQTLMEYPLTADSRRGHIYTAPPFIPPTEFFYVKVTGDDDRGYVIWRTTPTAISPRPPTPPSVYMPQITRGFYDATATIVCAVNSEIPYSVQWYKDGVKEGYELFYNIPTNVTLDLPRAGSFVEGIYTCNATNIAGYTARTTFLDISEPPPQISTPVNVSVLPGDDALLFCDVYSTVQYNVTWYRDNNLIGNNRKYQVFRNGSLLVRNVKLNNEGEYVCRAGNEGGFTQEKVHLKVQVRPRAFVTPEEQMFVLGQTVNLTCKAKGYPKPAFFWLRDSKILIPNDRLTINNNKLSISKMVRGDEGEYGCLAENIAGRNTATSLLLYIEKPEIVMYERQVLVASGDAATMKCVANGIPKPTIRWYKGALELKRLSYVQINDNGDLTILGTQEPDEGDYRCIAENEAGSDSVDIRLTVGAEPRVTNGPYNVGADIETNVSLACEATGDPEPKVYWTKDGHPLTLQGRISQSPEGTLHIISLAPEDEGRYACIAQNQFGTKEVSAFLTATGIVKPLIAYTNPFINVKEGKDVDLSCVILQGNPTPAVQWQRNNKVLPISQHYYRKSPGQVIIQNIQASHEGDYTCTASNVAGNSTYVVTINVQVPPRLTFDDETDSQTNFTVVEGEGVILPCSVMGDPRPTITWYKDESPISPTDYHYFIREDGSLEIFSTADDDMGRYRCTAKNNVGEVDKVIDLNVQVVPSIAGNELEEYTVIENETVVLPCEVSGRPDPNVTWRKNFVKFQPSSNRYLFGILGMTISSVKVTDQATYECIAKNVAGEATKVISLFVQIPPMISEEGETNLIVQEGEFVRLNCDTKGVPEPQITWKKNNVILDITDNGYRMTNEGSLIIDEAKLVDDGAYSCIATNNAGSSFKDFLVTVHSIPTLPLNLPNTTSVIENNAIIIECPAQGTPLPTILWFKDNVELTGEEIGIQFLDDGSLEIFNVKASDSGSYRCVAANVAGEVEHTTDLDVLIPPKLLGEDSGGSSRPTAARVIVNNTVVLFCPVDGDPKPQVTWYKNGQQIVEDSRITISQDGRNLTIHQTLVSDKARYKCEARNVAGETEKTIDLEVYVPPKVDSSMASPENMSVILGSSLIINCPITGIPPPLITWLKDDIVISPDFDPNIRSFADGRRLEVVSARVTDKGQYTCRGDNVAGTVQQKFNVTVYVPPSIDNQGVIDKPEVVIDNTLQLTCPASGIPRPKITWFKGNQPIKHNTTDYLLLDDGWTLEITEATQDDSTRFTCRAQNEAGTNEKAFDIHVLVPSKITRETAESRPRVLVNRTLVLNCHVEGIPPPQITWYKNDAILDVLTHRRYEILSDGRQLRVKSAQLSDTGVFTCEARNKAGEDRLDYDVEVQIPSTINDYGVRTNPKVVVNSTLTIFCPATGVPPPTITWLKDGATLDLGNTPNIDISADGLHLTVEDAQVDNTGKYTCQATNPAGKAELAFDVFVEVPPTISTDTNLLPKVIVGQSTVLHCPAEGIPPPEIIWMKNGQPIDYQIETSLRLQNGGKELHVRDARIEDGGFYTCIASNPAGISQLEFDMEIRVPPQIDQDAYDKQTKVNRGHSTILNCPATGLPPPEINWFKDGQPLILDSRMQLLTGGLQLKIDNTSISDTARYTCTATNPAGEVSADMDLSILVPPWIDESNVVYFPRVVQNRTVILECPVSGVPEPTVKWLMNNQPLRETDRMLLQNNNRRLEIHLAQVEDSAVYMCIANNEAGELRKKFSLEVQVPARIITEKASLEDLKVTQNQTINIDCPVEGIPPPSVIWLKDKVPLEDVSFRNLRVLNAEQRLEISNTQVEDAGKYGCIVTNVAGQEKREFNLKVHVPPIIDRARIVESYIVVERGVISMDCVTVGIPEPTVTWMKDDQIIELSNNPHIRILNGGQTFQIVSAQVNDTGKYTCHAESKAGLAKKFYDLAVHVPPRINGSKVQEKSVSINDQLILDCDAQGIPTPKITWMRQYQVIPQYGNPSVRITNNGRQLKLINAQLLDAGDYSCIATNPAGNASIDYSVTVLVPPTIEDGPSNEVGIVNRRVSLKCDSIGKPKPIVRWTKDGAVFPTTGLRHQMRNRGSIEFSSVRLEDAGIYVCTATNKAGSTSRRIELDVQVPPQVIGKQQIFMKAIMGEEIRLPCNVGGKPRPTIMWQKGTNIILSDTDQYVMDNGTLLLRRADERDSGVYICIARNNAGFAMTQVILNIQIPPRISVGRREFNVLQTRNIVLPCRADGIPIPKITWEKDGQIVRGNDFRFRVLSSGWLLIPYTRADDDGIYTCTAENEAGVDQVNLQLNVQVPPRIQKGRSILTASMGNVAEIPCVTSGIPAPDITWLRDSSKITLGGRYRNDSSGSLLISNLESDDTGRYTCIANNSAGRDTWTITLRVQVPPRMIALPKNQEIVIGGQIRLTCAAEGIPVPTITWNRNGVNVPAPRSINGRSTLVIHYALREDAGLYTCKAENPAGVETASATVLMKVPPRVTVPDSDSVVTVADKVILQCSVRGDPLPDITWTKDGRPIETSNRIQVLTNGSLIIHNSTSSDAGEYRCVASNEAGTSEGVAQLIVHQPPKFKIEPTNVRVVQGHVVTMDCVAEGEPTPTITWQRGWQDIVPSGRVSVLTNNSLRIIAAQLSDSGVYHCKAANRLGITIVESNITVVVNGRFSDWSPWDICSVTCGAGVQFRYRFCDNPAPMNGGRTCIGSELDTKSCVSGYCPVNGEWGNWEPWGECSSSCGQGERTRNRLCNNPPAQHGGLPCKRESLQSQTCTSKACPVAGMWGAWGPWSHCDVTCGDGMQQRTRYCDSPPPKHNGRPCQGEGTDHQTCWSQQCAVDGGWSPWMMWSACSHSCGGGTRTRGRRCDNPSPKFGGALCSGRDMQKDYCNPEPCPVHGNWAPWNEWGACSSSCGGGLMKRFRTCTNPSPSSNGRTCIGPNEGMKQCNKDPCPVHGAWGEWSLWSSCSQTCGTGKKERRRQCTDPLFGGRSCVGDDKQLADCTGQPCSGLPKKISGNVVGFINGIDITEGTLSGTVSPTGDLSATAISAVIKNIPAELAPHFQHLVSVLNPAYWTTALEVDGAVNGLSLTDGKFSREVQVEYPTGEILKMSQYAIGVDDNGVLQVDVIVRGTVPELPPNSPIQMIPYSEDYIQTGTGMVYAHSSRLFRVGGHPLPYAWNHTITYEKQAVMPYLVQTLRTDAIQTQLDADGRGIGFSLLASIYPGSPSNQCPSGFTLNADGSFCTDIDECSDSQMCSHFCHNSQGKYACSCLAGFVLDSDGQHCSDINECNINNGGCSPNQECINTEGSYKCAVRCDKGYQRVRGDQACIDIDECFETPGVCGQRCENTPGSYKCSCSKGFKVKRNGKCTDINECAEGIALCTHSCKNSIGSYKCACPRGYRLANNHACFDIDECTEGSHRCTDDQTCINSEGNYKCVQTCEAGYHLVSGVCQDIDECSSDHRCYSNQQCVNTPGSYKCACPKGYRSRGPGYPCLDINECVEIPGICAFRCVNVEGDFECRCPLGQKLLADRKSCAGLEYVTTPNPRTRLSRFTRSVLPSLGRGCFPLHKCNHQHYRYKRGTGTCPKGFHYDKKSRKCKDIDECVEDPGICQHNCTNTLGSFKCTCPPGYKVSRNGRRCIDINECIEQNIQCGAEQMCFNKRGDFTCIEIPCPTTYKRDPLTNYCVLECVDSQLPCPPGSRYADVIEFRTLALPSGILAHQDLIRLTAYNHQDIKLPKTDFRILENDPRISFQIRASKGTGIVYTLQPLIDQETYLIKVQAKSYDITEEILKYQTTFIVYISVAAYPY